MAKKKPLTPLGKAIDFYQNQIAVSNHRLGWLTGIDKSAIGRHKNGSTGITLQTLETYAHFLKVKASDIILMQEYFEKSED
jgi:DNA-binding Xre family transcriptional regulator